MSLDLLILLILSVVDSVYHSMYSAINSDVTQQVSTMMVSYHHDLYQESTFDSRKSMLVVMAAEMNAQTIFEYYY